MRTRTVHTQHHVSQYGKESDSESTPAPLRRVVEMKGSVHPGKLFENRLCDLHERNRRGFISLQITKL